MLRLNRRQETALLLEVSLKTRNIALGFKRGFFNCINRLVVWWRFSVRNCSTVDSAGQESAWGDIGRLAIPAGSRWAPGAGGPTSTEAPEPEDQSCAINAVPIPRKVPVGISSQTGHLQGAVRDIAQSRYLRCHGAVRCSVCLVRRPSCAHPGTHSMEGTLREISRLVDSGEPLRAFLSKQCKLNPIKPFAAEYDTNCCSDPGGCQSAAGGVSVYHSLKLVVCI